MPEKFDNATLREEITDYLYENAVPTGKMQIVEFIKKAIFDYFFKIA